MSELVVYPQTRSLQMMIGEDLKTIFDRLGKLNSLECADLSALWSPVGERCRQEIW